MEPARTSSVSAVPLPPSKDPWYSAPADFEAARPGTVLRVRTAPGDLTEAVASAAAVYNVLFRTTDSHDKPYWAVTTIFVPKSPVISHSGEKALLSLQAAYNTPNVDFSPSYTVYEKGGPTPNPAIITLPESIHNVVSRGWLINVPDFEGPRAAFSAAVQAGRATLDSVRAVLSLGATLGFNADKLRYAMWGYSGGSLASEKAAELQLQYAPELRFSGAALGGMVTKLKAAFDTINKTGFVGTLFLALNGIMNEYPDVDNYIRSRLKTSGDHDAAGFLAARSMESAQVWANYGKQDIFEYFQGGRDDLESPVLGRVFDVEWTMGCHGVPQMPIFAYKAISDQFSPISDTDALMARRGEQGANILYERNTVGGHIAEIGNGRGRALDWLTSVFDGSLLAEGHTIRDVTVAIVDSPL